MNAAAHPRQPHDSCIAWNLPTRFLHWLLALLIVGMGLVGLFMTQMDPSMAKLKVYALHKSCGIAVLVLVALRLLWRVAHRAPPPVPMPRWQRIAAQATHGLLYALMFAIPLAGWLYNSAANFPLQWFGLVQMPSIWPADPTVKHLAHALHEYGFWVLMALVALHAAAAVKHHVIDKDETLRRMLPGLPPPGDTP
ncbi:MAG: cytochrome b [Proteobacteria bacterium]|nr:cytochrome b [Pseudomonadota bacterium]